jgi:hypothetical protein
MACLKPDLNETVQSVQKLQHLIFLCRKMEDAMGNEIPGRSCPLHGYLPAATTRFGASYGWFGFGIYNHHGTSH